MDIEKLNRWHWVVIGLLVGLLLGWGASSLNDAGGLNDAGTIGVREFEQELLGNNRGYPLLRNVVVHRSDDRYTVTMQRLEMDPRERYPHNPRHFHYVAKRLDARTPYVPVDSTQAVDVRIDPGAELMQANNGRDYWTLAINGQKVLNWPAQLKLDGWKTNPNHWSDPGNGATVELMLRPANYQMTVGVDASQANGPAAGQLRISLNGHLLPAPVQTGESAGPLWRTTVPKEAFAPGDRQVLKFANIGQPVRIRQIRLLDSGYTVLDYLSSVKESHPQIAYRTAWWERPAILYTLWGTGGVLIIGVIWPTVLGLLLGAGFGRHAPAEQPYDLSRFKGEPEPKTAGHLTTDEPLDVEQLEALEQELRRSLAQQASTSDQPAGERPAIPQLDATPDESPRPDQADEHKDYQGEYYPVVRKSGDRHE